MHVLKSFTVHVKRLLFYCTLCFAICCLDKGGREKECIVLLRIYFKRTAFYFHGEVSGGLCTLHIYFYFFSNPKVKMT